MVYTSEIVVAAEVPDISLIQLVTAVAAAKYINLQGKSARVGPALDVPYSAYEPNFDLSLVARHGDTTLDTPPDQIARDFKFQLFDGRFFRPLCGDLLRDPEHRTRVQFETDFASLKSLIAPAQQELARDPDREVLGPAHLEFYDAANELIDFISEVLTIRLNSMRRSGAISALWAQLDNAS